jgi:hypothetical protein
MTDICQCKEPQVWVTGTGHRVCQCCARLSRDNTNTDCRHTRSKITEEGLVCSECGELRPMGTALIRKVFDIPGS